MNTRRVIKPPIFIMLSLCLTACISWVTPDVEPQLPELQQGEYQLDPNHGRLLFKIGHLGLSTYVGRFNQFDASLDFTPQNMAQAKLSAVVDMSSIDINNAKLEETLRGGNWLNVNQYPQAVFVSDSVTPITASQFSFNGQLTFRGISKPVSFNATFHGGADNWMTGKYTLGFSATGTIKRSDFDMGSYVPMVGDEVTIEIYAEFLKNRD
ncbi:YceI family protein [Shewanella sp. Scap07]|uniref:YceI family protein n=1 Tax=Shewanella sp. Scap07 TaxID=2589987 RepID=UPI0015B7EB2B|nr:YceI family protein [Shewanella sp. Scap07]QLE85862.1 YceI family protein [Shewanella sp. Scap07]